jgi:FdrA protein
MRLPLRWSLRPNAYHDSIKLMRVSEALSAQPGVTRAAAVMATPLNLELLADDGLMPSGVEATPDDMLIAILADDEDIAESTLALLDHLLHGQRSAQTASAQQTTNDEQRTTLEQAASINDANLAVIAVPGPLAAAEAYAALRSGLHVFLFSDNVALDDEIRLKRLAAEQGLLMMGPDCGTAIIDGVGLGFANRVQRGPVGIVGASGTGIQQLCCLLDLAGIGVAQAIGTGGRDLSSRVSGSMTTRALSRLDRDPDVHTIAVVSKPAGTRVARRLHADMEWLSKPVVACLLGTQPPAEGRVRYAETLTDMAQIIAETLAVPVDVSAWGANGRHQDSRLKAQSSKLKAHSSQRVYGLYTGGTLCSEAAQILDRMGAPHRLVDLGADKYTRGRAHPIIDPRLRASMLSDVTSSKDVVLLDVVLGDLAHPDPAGALIPALEALPEGTRVFATLVGTRQDPQDLVRQRETLEATGAQVFAGNALAAAAAGKAVIRPRES